MYLAGNGQADADYEQILQDIERYNITGEARDKLIAMHKPVDLYLEEDQVRAYELFCSSLQTQWQVSMSGTRIGLNYPAIESVFNLKGITYRPLRTQLFEQIQLLELGFLRQERLDRESK